MIECGIPLKRIREVVPELSKVVACLVSHDHIDHAEFLPKLEMESSVPIYCTEGTKSRYSLIGCNVIENDIHYKPGDLFDLYPVKLEHDVECLGFVIGHGRKTLFYATDTGEINYTITGLTHLMIEANYTFENMIESDRSKFLLSRTIETHLDIDQVVEFVKRHPDLEEIHLIHLSDAHSDAELFKRMVVEVSGVPVYIAES